MLTPAPAMVSGETIQRAFGAGWAGAVTKSIAQEPAVDARPRLARLATGNRVVGLGNIELISQRGLDDWMDDIALIKRHYPDHMLFASLTAGMVMEEWHILIKRVEEAGADASYPTEGREYPLSIYRQDVDCSCFSWITPQAS